MRKASMITIGLAILLATSAGFAQLQTVPPPPGGQAQQPPAGAGMQGGMDMMRMMQMMSMMHPAIAVDDTAIYIIRGSELLKLDKTTLRIISRTTLPAVEMPAMQGGAAGRGPGMTQMMPRPQMQSMMNSMRAMQSAQFERAFLQNMSAHHAGAIEMSRLAVQKATHPELKAFAQKIIDDQTRENRQFSQWMKSWYNTTISPAPMPMDQQITNRLAALSGNDFEIAYMQAMIMHHTEAITMAQMAEQKATHTELRNTAANIIRDQSAEIVQLRTWLSQWYGINA